MIRLASTRVWVCLVAVFCLLLTLILGLTPSRHINNSAHLTAAEIREVRNVVRRENSASWRGPVVRWTPVTIQEWVANVTRPIKSIEDTTNNAYELDRRLLSSLAAEAMTNPTVEGDLRTMEKRIRTHSGGASDPAVEVWYADKGARWGEAGYILEKGSNDWKVTVELFR